MIDLTLDLLQIGTELIHLICEILQQLLLTSRKILRELREGGHNDLLHGSFIDEYAILAESLTSGLGLTEEEKQTFHKTGHLPDPKTLSRTMADRPFKATTARLAAFEALKIALSNAPILIHPDYAKLFLLYVDACRKGIAAVLYQVGPDGKEHPVLFISRTLQHAEKNYAAMELECLAIVWTLKKLAHYVDGSQLTLITDHSALKWIWSVKETVNQ